MDAIKKFIKSSTYAPEILVAVPNEPSYKISQKFDQYEIAPVFVLVYCFDRQVSKNEFVYVFVGGRVK